MLEETQEDDGGKPFIKHEFNRDGDSYRSPYDNKYYPATEEETTELPPKFQELESKFNAVFPQYAKMYFDYCLANVYVMPDEESEDFSAAFLIKKEMEHEKHIEALGWDSVHTVHVGHKADAIEIKVSSTVFITLGLKWKDMGKMSLAGSCAQTKNKTFAKDANFT